MLDQGEISDSLWLYNHLIYKDERAKKLTQRTCEQVQHPQSALLKFTYIEEEVAQGILTPELGEERRLQHIQEIRNVRVKEKLEELPTAIEYWTCFSEKVGGVPKELCTVISILPSSVERTLAKLMKDCLANNLKQYPEFIVLCRENEWKKSLGEAAIAVHYGITIPSNGESLHKQTKYQLIGVSYCQHLKPLFASDKWIYFSRFFHGEKWYGCNIHKHNEVIETQKPFLSLHEVKIVPHLECAIYQRKEVRDHFQ